MSSDPHVIALRRALVASEDENANLRHENGDLQAEVEKLTGFLRRALDINPPKLERPKPLPGKKRARAELVWPFGCFTVRGCIEAKDCVGGCPTHSGHSIRQAVKKHTGMTEEERAAYRKAART